MIEKPQTLMLKGSISMDGKLSVRKIMRPEKTKRILLKVLLNNSGLSLVYSFSPIAAKMKQRMVNAFGPVSIAPITTTKNTAPVIARVIKVFNVNRFMSKVDRQSEIRKHL